MSNNKQKLELTWVGKNNPEYDIANIEPRILEERTDLSYGDKDTENMIIHGDNLLALKALLPEFEEKIKCIYIDPPFNTGAAFDHYDDSTEHSTWLSLMKSRLDFFVKLLSKEGSIFVHLDDNESDYLKVLMDETFGRKNFVGRITIDARSPSAFSTVNPGVFKASEYILWYAKDKTNFSENSMRIRRQPNYAYNRWLDNPEDDFTKWTFRSLTDAYAEAPKSRTARPDKLIEHFNSFIVNNAKQIWRSTEISDTGAGRATIEIKQQSLKEPERVFRLERNGYDPIYILNGTQIAFYSKNVHEIDGEMSATTFLTNIWSDIAWEGIAGEGGIQFKKGKKPEKLIKRCLDLASKENDFVLDSFLGSGTTASVAHKMGRKYIGIEMGEHAYTHVQKRMKDVVDGKDQAGVSKTLEWKGGGGFKFYELAPSFVVIDEFGNPVIDSYYSDTKLIRAMCKLTNYTFAPSPSDYWKHGKGQGNNSIYITTQMLSVAMVQQIVSHLGTNETLLICPKKFEPGCEKVDARITIKKIPQSILKACQFGRKEYLLPIKERAMEEIDEDEVDSDEN